MIKKIIFVLVAVVLIVFSQRRIGQWRAMRSGDLPAVQTAPSEENDGQTRAVSSGDHSLTIAFQNRTREYLLHVPKSYVAKRSYPLLFALHGGGGTGSNMIRLMQSQLPALADTEGFIVAYPSAYDRNWNDGRAVESYASQKENVDDVGFISFLIDDIGRRVSIDTKRVYVTGMSNGGLMTERLACELSDRIAAVAPVAGGIAKNIVLTCAPKRQVPMLMINGTADPLIPWDSESVLFFGKKYGEKLTVPDTIAFWVAKNGASAKPVSTENIDSDATDSTSVIKTVYQGPTSDSTIIVYAVQGGGHTWPGGSQYLPKALIGATSKDIDAVLVMWDFFKQYSLPE